MRRSELRPHDLARPRRARADTAQSLQVLRPPGPRGTRDRERRRTPPRLLRRRKDSPRPGRLTRNCSDYACLGTRAAVVRPAENESGLRPSPHSLDRKRTHAAAHRDDNGNSYAGTFNVTSFKKVGDVIRAYGTFTGTNVTNSADKATSAGYADVITNGTSNTAAAAAPAGSCQILDLTLGPINLDLLGLVVTTNPIHLNITAQQGPGNLLGNLLCAVTGLLDNTGTTGGGLSGLLTAITNLLNHILTQL